ncbi:MAG TPA: hypothetical protein VED40_05280 [Azospirillaceae bacterium]|nr:hypothetical protein [Azospirillaceae bacterium]
MDSIARVDQLPQGVPIYLFGAGTGGRLIHEALRRNRRVRVAGFIDNAKNGSRIGELPVLDLAGFAAIRTPGTRVVIASQYVEEISAQLRQAGIEDAADGSPLVRHLVEARVHAAERRRLALISAAMMPVMVLAGWALFTA